MYIICYKKTVYKYHLGAMSYDVFLC